MGENKIAFMFPGQGSQEVGMARDLFANDKYFRSLITCASDFVHADLEKICLKGPQKKLMLARYLQPLLSSVSLGYLRHLRQCGIEADYLLGHSLGEITALGASGVLDDEETVIIAAKRGMLMDEAASLCDGTMIVVMFVNIETVEMVLNRINKPDCIALANDNAPNQVVLSGDRKTLEHFAEHIKKEGGRCKEIIVAGPWHSHFIESARIQYQEWVENVKFRTPKIPLILNATTKPEKHSTTIKHLVTWQLTSPVYWRECMDTLKEYAVDTVFEIGTGRILSGLLRLNKFPKTTNVFNINNLRGVESAKASLQ